MQSDPPRGLKPKAQHDHPVQSRAPVQNDPDNPRFRRDRAMTMTCSATTLIDDARTRVTRFDFAPGDQTGWHRHEMNYVITALTDCNMRLELPGGETRDVTVPAGTAYARDEGVEHNVINAGAAPMAFVEVELK